MPLPLCFFFDLDGTLLDSLRSIESSLHAAFAACGMEMRHANLRAEIGPPIRTILQALATNANESQLQDLEHAFRLDYDSQGWKKTTCYPGARVVLETLHERGHRLFIVSNKPRQVTLKILESEGVLAWFEQVCTRDGRTPPFSGKQEMMLHVMEEHGLQSADCVMVGDTLEDAEAATAHSIPFVFMTHGYGIVPADNSIPVATRLDSFEAFLPFAAQAESDR